MWDFLAERTAGRIDYVEFWASTKDAASPLGEAQHGCREPFFGFDTFTGLPEDWSTTYPLGHFDTGGRPPATDDPRVRFVKGLFQDTLPAFLADFAPRSRLIVHNDSDLYSSTLFCLTSLDRMITPGTIVIFDEFGDVMHEFRALQDYLASYRRKVEVLCSHDNFFTMAVVIV